ncbi:MAG TPA: protoporphyrinogen oxidase [Candidatus Polarisedimenticolaceae bacterium]|nr:protoporphyrinogen oxidase [Candidatus Polarisedimenticolaceae bacterium]
MPTIAVVGGGLAGLSTAFELAERAERFPEPIDVVCFEADTRPGGKVRTTRENGFLCEWGPTGFLDDAPATLTLVRRLGLEARLLPARDDRAQRFVFRRGKLRALPGDPRGLWRTDLLSWRGKLRLLAEPLVRPRPAAGDESLFDFTARRLGREAAEVVCDAAVGGIYAGDARSLSVRAAVPALHTMEQRHGGLLRALQAQPRGPANGNGNGHAPPRLTSFRDGMEELISALARELGSRLQSGNPVRLVSDLGRRGFRVLASEGPPLDVDAVVLACPAAEAAKLVESIDEPMAAAMAEIPSAPLALVQLGYEVSAATGPPPGFGCLIPRGQGPRMIGTFWSSEVFEHRAPKGWRLLTAMLGGAHDPEATRLGDDALVAQTRRDLEQVLGLLAAPRFVRLLRREQAVPQYTLGHLDRVAAIDAALARHPGLAVCGSSYRGISANACIEESSRVAETVLGQLRLRAAV